VFTESVIREMTRLAMLHGAMNLAQGYPDFPAPDFIKQAGMAAEDRTARGVFVVEVPHLAKLQEVMGGVRKVGGVTRVERRQKLVRPASAARRAGGQT